MFSGAVDPGKWFFMKQHPEFMLAGDPFHNIHKQLVMVDCQVYLLVHGSAFELVGSYFIMTCLDRNTKFMRRTFKILDETHNPLRYRSEIMIGKLLVF